MTRKAPTAALGTASHRRGTASTNHDDYFSRSSTLAMSLLYILPLLISYELGMQIVRPPVASWAGDLIHTTLQKAFGSAAVTIFNISIIAAIVCAVSQTRKQGRIQLTDYPLMLGESLVYSFILVLLLPLIISLLVPSGATTTGGGSSAVALLQQSQHGARSVANDIILSTGAGVYEELVFRFALMTGLYHLVRKLTSIDWLSATVAIIISSVAFSTCHYIGGSQENTAQFIHTFSYRTLSGIIFAGLYIYRGLAVASYTHVFYDLIVLLVVTRDTFLGRTFGL